MKQEVSSLPQSNEQHPSVGQLGPLLCWAVVFADIGSSIYYVPGILYGRVGDLAGFFVLLTMSVFVLLTLKYAEVSARFPEGGGVVTVAAQAINSWVGALGGMFILVSYFLTAAISCLSAIQYFSVVLPAIGPIVLEITITVLVLLGLLNWVGISESAKVSLVGALIAFGSDLAIIWTVFTHIPISELPLLFSQMFQHTTLTPTSILVGFVWAFLAFSGLVDQYGLAAAGNRFWLFGRRRRDGCCLHQLCSRSLARGDPLPGRTYARCAAGCAYVWRRTQ
jgi:amino acid transporter